MTELAQFVKKVSECRSKIDVVDELVKQVETALEPLLDRALLPSALFNDPTGDPLHLLLHRSEVVTVFAISSPPGFVSRIHDHGSWGVVGQVSGVETEYAYRLRNDAAPQVASDTSMVGLTEVSSSQLSAGDIIAIVPPHRDIHEVRTSDAGPSVSLHAFVRDPVSNGFRYFEPRLYATHGYTGLYDNEPRV